MEKYDYNSDPQGIAEIKSEKRDDNLTRVIELIDEKLKNQSRIKIYEPGCGGGRNLEFIKKRYGEAVEVFGTDISQTSIDYIKKKIEGDFCVAKTVDDCFEDEFDLIIMLDILEHLPSIDEVDKTIGLANKKLKKDGSLLISCPIELNKFSITWFFKKINFWPDLTLKYYGHTIQFSEKKLLRIINRHFEIAKKKYGVHFFSQADTFLFFYFPKQCLSCFGGDEAVSSFRESNIKIDSADKKTKVSFREVLLKIYFFLRTPFLFIGYHESRMRKKSKFGAMNISLECHQK